MIFKFKDHFDVSLILGTKLVMTLQFQGLCFIGLLGLTLLELVFVGQISIFFNPSARMSG